MSSRVNVINGARKLADKLASFGAQGERAIQQEVAATTALAHEAIVDKITNDVAPHSGMHRERNPQPVVTDLVDTGAYRQSWQVSFPTPMKGVLSTNIEYALALEYGTDNMAGFYVARDTARKMRGIFVQRMKKRIRELMK